MALWMLPAGTKSLADERAEKRRAKAKTKADVYAEVDRRDGMVCRGTGRRLVRALDLVLNRREHHHILPRSKGGKDTTANLCNVSLELHELITRHRVTVTGNADQTLTFSTDKPKRTWKSPNPKRSER